VASNFAASFFAGFDDFFGRRCDKCFRPSPRHSYRDFAAPHLAGLDDQIRGGLGVARGVVSFVLFQDGNALVRGGVAFQGNALGDARMA
jgi:hypothetical protein